MSTVNQREFIESCLRNASITGFATIPVEGDEDSFGYYDEDEGEVYIVTVKRAKFVPVEGE